MWREGEYYNCGGRESIIIIANVEAIMTSGVKPSPS